MLYNSQRILKEVDQILMFKGILDNGEESSIILSGGKLEYANDKFLTKFKMNILKCATDRMIQIKQ